MQRQGVILSLPALHNRVGTHLTARMQSDPASSETTGIISKRRPNALKRLTKRRGVFGCKKSDGSIRTSRNPVRSSNRCNGQRKNAVSSGESPSFRFTQETFFESRSAGLACLARFVLWLDHLLTKTRQEVGNRRSSRNSRGRDAIGCQPLGVRVGAFVPAWSATARPSPTLNEEVLVQSPTQSHWRKTVVVLD